MLGALAGTAPAVSGELRAAAPAHSAQARLVAAAPLSLAFEPNQGQTAEPVRFLARQSGSTLFLTPDEAVLALSGKGVLRLSFLGSRSDSRLSGEEELPGRSHYFLGDRPGRWRTGVRRYRQVRYDGLFPGIDLVFHGTGEQLEFDLELGPGSDPRDLRLALVGAERAAIDSTGDLVLSVGGEPVRLLRPRSFQRSGGSRREVASAYRLLAGGPALQVGFVLGPHDAREPLVIDPVLAYSTYLGGGGLDVALGVDADAAGNTYVTGYTNSPDFPRTGSVAPVPGNSDTFLTKLGPEGELIFSTFLGGVSADSGQDVAVGAAGEVYLTGATASPDFPLVHPVLPLPPALGLTHHAFVTKLAPDGAAIEYSTLLGGSGRDAGFGIAVGPAGHAYVTGSTNSPDFPVLGAPQPTFAGGFYDAFVAKLAPTGSSLVYSTYFGGSGDEFAEGIAVGPAGRAYVTGNTSSSDLPTVRALQDTFHGGIYDVYVAGLSPSGSAWEYATYLGGSSFEAVGDIALDPAGNAWVAGQVDSADFPVLRPLQPFRIEDAFLTQLAPTGALRFSTFLGGSLSDSGLGVAADASGVYVTGSTSSRDYPLRDPLQADCAPVPGEHPQFCRQDVFVTKLDLEGRGILFSTFLGGKLLETGQAIAVDPRGGIHVAGFTSSRDFPIRNAVQPTYGGGDFSDAFAARIVLGRPPDCSGAFASPAVLWPPSGRLVPVRIAGLTDPDGDPISLTMTGIFQDEPLTRRGLPDAAGLQTAVPRVRASRAGGGDGRVYHLRFEAQDGQGGSCRGEVTVCVPHDQGRSRTCVDSGELVDSTGG